MKPDIDYVKSYANDLIERDYRIHVLKEEATNTSSLSSIPETTTASKASASATVQTGNPSPAAKEEHDSPSIAGSVISESSDAMTMITLMKNTQEAQMETNNTTLKAMHGLVDSISKINNAIKVDKSFERMTTKLLLEQKYTNFPAIPESRTQETLSIWFESIMRICRTTPWDINGTSILEMRLPPDLPLALEAYCIRSMKLYLIMTKLLQVAECQVIIDQLDSQLTANDGVSLLHATKEAILPRTSLQVPDVLADIGACLQLNGKTVESFGTRGEHLFIRLKNLECTTMEQLQMATLQRGFLQGAYSDHESLGHVQTKLKNNESKLSEWTKLSEFLMSMTEIFTNYDVYSNGKMKKLNQSQVHQARSTGCAPEPSQSDSRRLVNLLHMSDMTEDEADEIFKITNCLLCRYPKSHAKNHHMTTCEFLKKYGIDCTHDRTSDMRIPKKYRTKATTCRKKNDALDAEDEKKAAVIDKKVQAKKKKDAALQEQAEAEAAGMKTVGADGKDTKTSLAAGDSIQKKLDSQSSSTPAGSGRAAGTMGCFQSNSYRGTSFVDATTACNDINDDVNGYFCSTLSESLSIYDVCGKEGCIRESISFARHIPTSCSNSDNDDDVIPDSGATSTMLKFRPKFSITQFIPENNDLRVPLQVLTAEDWDIPNYILDGDDISDDYLNNYKNRIDMLNGIAKGRAVTTCANRKLQVDALEKALGLNHARNNDSSSDARDNDFFF